MPKHFKETERQAIKEALISKGTALFSVHGLKKTSIDELTREVGISKGTFYLFFESKEKLYISIFERIESKVRRRIEEIVENPHKSEREKLKEAILYQFQSLEANPILKSALEGKSGNPAWMLSEEDLDDQISANRDFIRPHLEKWASQGLINGEPDLLIDLLRSIFFLVFHKTEIGSDTYPRVVEALVEITVNGIMKEHNH